MGKGIKTAVLVLSLAISQCSYIFVEEEYRKADFVPVHSDSVAGGFLKIEDEEYIWEREGLVLHIQHLNDEQLKALFPEQASRGKYSTNPFTYAGWVSPDLDISPDRFTVFRLELHNITYPIVQIDPLKCRMTDDRGEIYFPYSLERSDLTPNDLTSYYLRLRGPTGNDRIRFDERIGNAKSTLFFDNKIYKGQSAEGLLVFDPVPSNVDKIELRIQDFVLEFSADEWPVKTVDLSMQFKRRPPNMVKRDTMEKTTSISSTGMDTVVTPGTVIIEQQYLSRPLSSDKFANGFMEIDGPVGAKIWLVTPVSGQTQSKTLPVYARPGGNRIPGNEIKGAFRDKERITVIRSFRLDEVSYYHYAKSETGELKGWIDWRYVLFDPIEE